MAGVNGRACSLAALTVLAGLAGTPALANEPGAADVQWAQIILKEKGFNIGGRANGQMTPQTRTALSAYQKSVGLPATGNLDSATVAKMMGERKPPGTTGNLASQKPGSTPKLSEKDVAPRAAVRSGDVHGAGGTGDVMLGPIVRQAPSGVSVPSAGSAQGFAAQGFAPAPAARPAGASPSAAHNADSTHGADAGPVPQAAPRPTVSAATADGQAVPATILSKGDEDGGAAPGWLRYGVMAVLGGTLGFLGFGWWRSGRPATPGTAPQAGEERGGDATRREPRFTPAPDELVPGPRLGPVASRGRGR